MLTTSFRRIVHDSYAARRLRVWHSHDWPGDINAYGVMAAMDITLEPSEERKLEYARRNQGTGPVAQYPKPS